MNATPKIAARGGPDEIPPLRARINFRRIGVIAAASIGLWIFLFAILAVETHANFFVRHIALPTLLVALIVAFAVRQDRRWNGPARRFKRLLQDINDGAMPIEALEEVDGSLSELRDLVHSVLHELRHQKQRIAELNAEMRAKIANRTDALERTVGSLRTQANRDALTRLFNRRMLDDFLPKIIERCREEGHPLAVLMIDVDNFKPINDTLGHAAGDQLLRDISQIIRSTIRDHDAAFRCGGDEFVIVLPKCPSDGARILADRITSLVDELAKTIKAPLAPGLSIGMAVLTDSTSTMESLMREADARLYEIKRRNKQKHPGNGKLTRAG